MVRVADMESEDYSFYQGLIYLLEHNVADLGYELTFSTEVSFVFVLLVYVLYTLVRCIILECDLLFKTPLSRV